MSDHLAKLPDLLARLDAPLPWHWQEPDSDAYVVMVSEDRAAAAERAECAAAIRALVAERDQIAALLDRHKIAMPGGSRQWMLVHRVEIACMAATDQSDGEQHSARIAELERDVYKSCRPPPGTKNGTFHWFYGGDDEGCEPWLWLDGAWRTFGGQNVEAESTRRSGWRYVGPCKPPEAREAA